MTAVDTAPSVAEDRIFISYEPTVTPPAKPHRGAEWALLLPVLVLQVLMLLPSLRTGWLGDDGFDFSYRSYLQMHNVGFWSDVTSDVSVFMNNGRFYPVLFYQGYGTFYWIHNVVLYKALILLVTALASVAVFKVLRALGLRPASAALAILFASACVQLRDYHDAVLSYEGFIQILLIEICVSLLLFHSWMQNGGRLKIVAAVALFVLACATYEACLIFALLYTVFALQDRGTFKARVYAVAPFGLVGAAFIGIAAFLRAATPTQDQRYQPHFDAGAVASTFAKQEAGVLPGNFQWHAHSLVLSEIAVSAVFLGALFAVIGLMLCVGLRSQRNADSLAMPALFGLGLLVLPALPLAIAPKYQDELTWGWPYLPVMIQVFGFGTLLAVLVSKLSGRHRLAPFAIGAVAALAIGASAAYDGASNQVTADSLAPFKKLQDAQETALQQGLLAAVPNGSTLYISPPYYWETDAFVFGDSNGKRFNVQLADNSTPKAIDEGAGCLSRNDVDYVLDSARKPDGTDIHITLRCIPRQPAA